MNFSASTACRTGQPDPCPHTFTVKELLVEAGADDGDGRIRCPEFTRRIEAALMLDGLRGTGLLARIDSIDRALAAQASTLNAINARQQDTLNGIRTPLEHRAAAGMHAPALYSITRTARTGVRRVRIAVALWCERPTGPHTLGPEGTYTVTEMPAALTRHLHYLHVLITAPGLATPVLGAAGVDLSDHAKDRFEAAA